MYFVVVNHRTLANLLNNNIVFAAYEYFSKRQWKSDLCGMLMKTDVSVGGK